MIQNAWALVERGWLQAPLFFSFVLGQTGAQPATPRQLLFLAESLPAGSLWGAAGHGGHDLSMSALAISLGGHARAGFEDNPYYRPGERATGNAQLIGRLARLAQELGRPVATPAEARQMLGLPARG
jgi:3-keto-5-aminohexanoate cleavage enzyme